MTPLHQRAVAAFRAEGASAALTLFEAAAESGETGAALLNDHGCCLTALGREAEASGLFARAAPSRWQVRSPINKNAIGRWQRYGAAIKPMLDVL